MEQKGRESQAPVGVGSHPRAGSADSKGDSGSGSLHGGHLPATAASEGPSAIMPTVVLEVTKKFMRHPIRILVKKLNLERIKQFYINVEREPPIIG
ncbi:uncharacterized protein LOC144201783 [Stigmatopora nigra]